MRNWIPARSIARPIMPSSASISRTRWPLPSPPIAGLHDISPIVARLCVNSSARAPTRAAAAAASHPACPPPTTITPPFLELLFPRNRFCRIFISFESCQPSDTVLSGETRHAPRLVAYKVTCHAEIECPVPLASKQIDIERQQRCPNCLVIPGRPARAGLGTYEHGPLNRTSEVSVKKG